MAKCQAILYNSESHFFTRNDQKAIELLATLEAKSMENESILYSMAMSYKELKNQPKAI